MRITIPLDKFARRPIATLNWFHDCRALIDTGALFPVWTKNEMLLVKLGAKLERKCVTFSGFGGKTMGSLYRVNFIPGSLQYVDMPIVAKPMNELNCHMILSATMFENMIYSIDTINKYFSIDTTDNQLVRILKISDEYGTLSAYLASTHDTTELYKKSPDYQTAIPISLTAPESQS